MGRCGQWLRLGASSDVNQCVRENESLDGCEGDDEMDTVVEKTGEAWDIYERWRPSLLLSGHQNRLRWQPW